MVYCAGFLPGLAYIKPALDHRNALQKKLDEKAALTDVEQREAVLLERTANPWKFPNAIRELILMPARSAKIMAPIACSAPLVDAVFMPHEQGIVIPLANYTAEPIAQLTLKVEVPRPVAQVESALLGRLAFKQSSPGSIELSLPLENNDFVKLRFK